MIACQNGTTGWSDGDTVSLTDRATSPQQLFRKGEGKGLGTKHVDGPALSKVATHDCSLRFHP